MADAGYNDNNNNNNNNNNDDDDSGVIIIDDVDVIINDVCVKGDDDIVLKNKIDIIMGQTEYGAEEARKLLAENSGDEIAVIRMYLGLSRPPALNTNVVETKSKNQLIYQEIRKFMDGCKELKK